MKSLSTLGIFFLMEALFLVEAEVASVCPDGKPPVNCFVDPCEAQDACVVGATCVPNYCGGCFTNCECNYNGKTYTPGKSFPAVDGCNTCTCGEYGDVGCTEIACTPFDLCKIMECKRGYNCVDGQCILVKPCEKENCKTDYYCKDGECVLCPLFRCKECEIGQTNVLDKNGCKTCSCEDACNNIKCKRGYRCEGGQCIPALKG